MKKIMPEPRHSDAAHIAWILLAILLAGVLFGPMISSTRAADTLWLSSVASLGTDSTVTQPDSVQFFWIDGTGAVDSGMATFVRNDSMEARYALVPSTQGWTKDYAPAAWAIWYWPGGARDRDGDVDPVPWTIIHVDTLAQATRILDSLQAVLDSIQNFDVAGHFIADIQAVLDSLNLHDDWVARQTTLTTTQTTVGSVRDTVNAVLDTLQLHDGWVARQDTLSRALQASRMAALRWGAIPTGYDSTTTVYYPATGAANKDSVKVFSWTSGSPTIVFSGYYQHSNVATVADSMRTKP